MRRLFIITCGFMLGTMLQAQKVNDPHAEVRDAKNFHGINVSNAFDVYLTQGNEEAVAVSAASLKDRELIIVEVKNGILHVRLDKKGWKWNTRDRKLRAYISFKQIDQLSVSGACDVFIAGTLKADELRIDQSGASDLKFGKDGQLDVQKLTVDISGASDMRLTGRAAQVVIEASGASSFKGYDLQTETCTARASGASDIQVTVNRELSAQASGASDIRYRGEGVIRDIRNSGSSSISKVKG